VGRPIFAGGGKSMMHMETLTEIALERCDSARYRLILPILIKQILIYVHLCNYYYHIIFISSVVIYLDVLCN
jgi:hypothetical protein